MFHQVHIHTVQAPMVDTALIIITIMGIMDMATINQLWLLSQDMAIIRQHKVLIWLMDPSAMKMSIVLVAVVRLQMVTLHRSYMKKISKKLMQ